METSPDAFIIYDHTGTISWANRNVAALFKVDVNEIIGLSQKDSWCFFLKPNHSPVSYFEMPAAIVLRTGEPVREKVLYLVRPGGERRAVVVSAGPIVRGAAGSLDGVIVCFRDRTEPAKVEEALRRSEQRWKVAVQGSRDGIVDWDLCTNTTFFSERSCDILGYPRNEPPNSFRDIVSQMHPEDVQRFNDNVTMHLAGMTDVFAEEFRVLKPDGNYQWVMARATVSFGPKGEAVQFAGSLTDVQERKEWEERLVASNSRFEALIHDLKIGVVVEDSQRQVVLANQAFCNLMNLAYPPEALLGANAARLFEEAKELYCDPDGYIDRIAAILEERKHVNSEELYLTTGGVYERDYVPVFLTDEYGGHYWMYRDVTERKAYEQKIHTYNTVLEEQRHELEHANGLLAKLAITDALTGVRNRRAFEEALAAEYQRARRHNSTFSVIMVDIDNFKQFNDVYGHIEGDNVIKIVANVLDTHTREYDVVARYGGEEFVVVLPETSGSRAASIAERFRVTIEEWPWDKRRVTASFGVAELPPSMPDPERVVAHADAALYQSKHNGRNMVTLSSELEE